MIEWYVEFVYVVELWLVWLGYVNVMVIVGDGSGGLFDKVLFDVIFVVVCGVEVLVVFEC